MSSSKGQFMSIDEIVARAQQALAASVKEAYDAGRADAASALKSKVIGLFEELFGPPAEAPAQPQALQGEHQNEGAHPHGQPQQNPPHDGGQHQDPQYQGGQHQDGQHQGGGQHQDGQHQDGQHQNGQNQEHWH